MSAPAIKLKIRTVKNVACDVELTTDKTVRMGSSEGQFDEFFVSPTHFLGFSLVSCHILLTWRLISFFGWYERSQM
jgi:hypothetical protein